MKSILNKIFKSDNNLNQKNEKFKEIQTNTKINKIFKSISEFSDKTEIRYIGGCVRKILNNELVNDIDLATNISPEQVSLCLKKNNINFYETGIEHGPSRRPGGVRFQDEHRPVLRQAVVGESRFRHP